MPVAEEGKGCLSRVDIKIRRVVLWLPTHVHDGFQPLIIHRARPSMNPCGTLVSQAPHVELHNVKTAVKLIVLQDEDVPPILRTFIVQVCPGRSGSRGVTFSTSKYILAHG